MLILHKYFSWLGHFGRIPYIALVVAQMLTLEVVVAWTCHKTGIPDRHTFDGGNIIVIILATILFSPIIETLLLQFFIIETGIKLGLSISISALACWLLFASAHISAGLGTFLSGGLTGGFFLTWTYRLWREKSIMDAIIMTAACHFFNNLIAVLFIYGQEILKITREVTN